MQKFITHSATETQELAKNLAQKCRDGAIIALSGPLGAGKTAFTQGFAQGLGISERLISPTFILMRQYNIPNHPHGKLFHIDLYRLENAEEIESLGLEEIFANPQNITLIEWAEKLGQKLPPKAIKIKIKILSKNSREIEVRG